MFAFIRHDWTFSLFNSESLTEFFLNARNTIKKTFAVVFKRLLEIQLYTQIS